MCLRPEAKNICISFLLQKNHEKYTLLRKSCESDQLTTFVRLQEKTSILHVTGLKNRLVISLSENLHDLRTARFFLLIKGSSPGGSFGFLHFRQDQLHIDLFVFFSVFFSCFFLFLAFCILVWRVKSTFDIRRARERHAIELLNMAQRPMGSYTVQFSPETTNLSNISLNSRPKSRILEKVGSDKSSKKNNTGQRLKSGAYTSSKMNPGSSEEAIHTPLLVQNESAGPGSPVTTASGLQGGINGLCLQPLAVEPLTLNNATVATVLVQMPQNSTLSFGCVLTPWQQANFQSFET